jgi:ribosomal protein L16 Arg81 hydroxylase
MSAMQIVPIEVVDSISKKDFLEHYQKPGKPVVIKNYSEGWKARKNWTYDNLRKAAGHHKVKLHGKWLDNEPARIQMPPVKEVPFSEYIDLLESNEPSDFRIFLFNLFKIEPSLSDDFEFTDITDGYLKDFPYLFFGCAGSDVRLHYDIDLSHVFITQFGGTKRITLFDQDQSKYLYKIPFTTHSAADLNDIDYDKFPALKYAKGMQCELKPGETLYMPSGIWHYIQYLDSSFSLSLRAVPDNPLHRAKGIYNVTVIRNLDNFLSKYYKNSWSDFKLKKAIENTNELLAERERR